MEWITDIITKNEQLQSWEEKSEVWKLVLVNLEYALISENYLGPLFISFWNIDEEWSNSKLRRKLNKYQTQLLKYRRNYTPGPYQM